MTLPGEYVQPVTFQPTGNQHILKPTFGSVGSQFVEFQEIKEFNAVETEKCGREIETSVEICLIQNDRFTRAPIRVKDLSPRQKIDLAPIYERFKTQKDSKETSVVTWKGVSDREKGFLMQAGVMSVEQLASFADEETYRLGPSGMDLRTRAKKHISSKDETKKEEATVELQLLRQEKEQMAQRLKALEETMYARLAQSSVESIVEAPKKKAGRPRKVTHDEAIAA